MKRYLATALSLAVLVSIDACISPEDPCPAAPLFSVAPVDPDSIRVLDPLGNLNPPGHVFPSDHMGIYLLVEEGAGHSPAIEVFCPGTLRLVQARAAEHVNAGIVDFALTLEACEEMQLVLGHISALDEELYGRLGDYTGWDFGGEYSTAGEIYRHWVVSPFFLLIPAGTRLGSAGGHPGQGGLDFGFYDRTRPSATSANPSRWGDSRYTHAVSPLEYFEEGPVKEALAALVDRDDMPGDAYPFGRVMQDVPGSAHGCWFKPGASFPPEDEHLALVQWNRHPSLEVVTVGISVATLGRGLYPFEPDTSGRLNRRFADLNADGQIYGYLPDPMWTPGGYAGTIIISMPDAETLWIEGFDEVMEDPADWSFTDSKTVFER